MESSHSKLQPVGQYPAGVHATKVARELFKATNESTRLILYLEGEATRYRNDTDREIAFRSVCCQLRLTGRCLSYLSRADITFLSTFFERLRNTSDRSQISST